MSRIEYSNFSLSDFDLMQNLSQAGFGYKINSIGSATSLKPSIVPGSLILSVETSMVNMPLAYVPAMSLLVTGLYSRSQTTIIGILFPRRDQLTPLFCV